MLAFLALFQATSTAGHPGTFDFVELAQLAQSGGLSTALAQNLHWVWLGAHGDVDVLGGVSRICGEDAVVPFHTWLPSTYARHRAKRRCC